MRRNLRGFPKFTWRVGHRIGTLGHLVRRFERPLLAECQPRDGPARPAFQLTPVCRRPPPVAERTTAHQVIVRAPCAPPLCWGPAASPHAFLINGEAAHLPQPDNRRSLPPWTTGHLRFRPDYGLKFGRCFFTFDMAAAWRAPRLLSRGWATAAGQTRAASGSRST